jgi:hypothetical protein
VEQAILNPRDADYKAKWIGGAGTAPGVKMKRSPGLGIQFCDGAGSKPNAAATFFRSILG